jgi:lipoate-protein ligase A
VDVVRRISGGGSVFHGQGKEVTYSIVLPEERLPVRDFVSSFEYLTGGIARALRGLGLEAEFAPINDVVINGKKIGGSAQVRRNGAVLQHGTVLLDMDKDLAFSVLKVPPLKTQEKSLHSPADRVTSIRAEGVDVSRARLRRELETSFAKALEADFTVSRVTEDESRASKAYAENRYSSPSWTRSR